MDDAAAGESRGADALAHEPPSPGWPPRPPAVLLRRSRLEQHRLRRLERLREERPAIRARIDTMQRASRGFWDAVLPRDRVLPVTLAVLALTVFDGAATFALVGSGVAEEGNPLVADLVGRIGLAAAMGIRVLVGVVLTLVLAWLATWRREVRPVLGLVAALLSFVAALHLVGLAWGLL